VYTFIEGLNRWNIKKQFSVRGLFLCIFYKYKHNSMFITS